MHDVQKMQKKPKRDFDHVSDFGGMNKSGVAMISAVYSNTLNLYQLPASIKKLLKVS